MTGLIIGNEFLDTVIPLIKVAKFQISIIIFDWRFYFQELNSPRASFTQEILEARNRGTKVQVIANSQAVQDNLRKIGIDCRRINSYKMIHAKAISIDDKTLIVGSHNFSSNAFEKNLELGLITTNLISINKFADFFAKLWLAN